MRFALFVALLGCAPAVSQVGQPECETFVFDNCDVLLCRRHFYNEAPRLVSATCREMEAPVGPEPLFDPDSPASYQGFFPPLRR